MEDNKENEERLQANLKLLLKYSEQGKINVTERSKGIIDSLVKVRKLPDGSFDLSTVDGPVRAIACVVEEMDYRERTKAEITLQEIQNAYIELFEKNLGEEYKIMKKANSCPRQFASFLSSKQEIVNQVVPQIEGFLNVVKSFWESTHDAVRFHIEDMEDTHKAVFGGDLFPSNTESIASKCGIYTDTIILPDPYLRCYDMFKKWSPQKQAYYYFKHGLNILQYKDLIKADTDKPIIIIAPDTGAINSEEKKLYQKWGLEDTIIHSNKLFGREFVSIEELVDFISFYNNPEELATGIVDKSKILFDIDLGNNPILQLEEGFKLHSELFNIKKPGLALLNVLSGRFGVCNEILIKSHRFRATPIIDAPTSWKYFNWKLEYDANEFEKITGLKDLHIVKGLQAVADNEMTWLGKIPHEALIELRKSQAIYEIRDIIGKGLDDIVKLNPTDFNTSANVIVRNIDNAFKQHMENLKELRKKKWKFAYTDIGSWLVTGTLAITAAATQSPSFGISAIVADQITGAPKLKDIPKSIIKLTEESQKLKKSPVGMLFSYKE